MSFTTRHRLARLFGLLLVLHRCLTASVLTGLASRAHAIALVPALLGLFAHAAAERGRRLEDGIGPHAILVDELRLERRMVREVRRYINSVGYSRQIELITHGRLELARSQVSHRLERRRCAALRQLVGCRHGSGSEGLSAQSDAVPLHIGALEGHF